MVYPGGNFVIRFRADNPDKCLLLSRPVKTKPRKLTSAIRVWLFHCHIDWHLYTGLVATMIEAPLTLQETLTLPPDHLAACRAADVPYAGNAAGNTVDLLDLDGQNEAVAPLPAG